jgi:hypothetical protein
MKNLFQVLFHIDCMGDEFGLLWRSPEYDPDNYMFDRQQQRRRRARFCYKDKVKMLSRTLIEVGLPQARMAHSSNRHFS